MSARDIEKLLDGPAGYAIAISAAVIGVIVLLEFFKNNGAPAGYGTGSFFGNAVGGLGNSIVGPFADWANGDPAGTYVENNAP